MKVELITNDNDIRRSIINAIQGARFAKKSEGKSDSGYRDYVGADGYEGVYIGENDLNLAKRLAHTPNASGHDKFLQQIHFSVDIAWSRFMWQEFDTYRVGISKQSESTMHTLIDEVETLSVDNFDVGKDLIKDDVIRSEVEFQINEYIHFVKYWCDNEEEHATSIDELLRIIKSTLPESFIQKRRVCMNYANMKTIYSQRKNHKNIEWQLFLNQMKKDLLYPTLWTGEE